MAGKVIKIENVEVEDVGTIASSIKYIVTACTIHPDFPGEQVLIKLIKNIVL